MQNGAVHGGWGKVNLINEAQSFPGILRLISQKKGASSYKYRFFVTPRCYGMSPLVL